MRSLFSICVAGALLALSTTANAATIAFNTDPFEGSAALTTPGRQIVGGELFTDFSIPSDVFSFDSTVFGIDDIHFANDVAGNLPTTGLNVIVLRDLDNDGNAATPFAAGNAANLIADRVTSSGAGFFIYFNSGLDLPRLVFSTDLSESTADLKILARVLNLNGQTGREALPSFTEANFEVAAVPEPTSLLLVGTGLAWIGRTGLRRLRARA